MAKKVDLHLTIDPTILKEAKKREKTTIPSISAFLEEMLEREFAGEFQQFKIKEKENELASLKSQHTQIQTHQEKQEKRAEESYRKAEEEMLERRRHNMLRRKEGI